MPKAKPPITEAPTASESKPVRMGRGRRPLTRKLRDAKDALYRQHIIDAAERIFSQQGFQSTRMQDVAAAAGISLATLYQSFPGKEELHRSILVSRDQEMLDKIQARWGPALQRPQSVEHVLLLMETHLHFLLEHPEYLQMQLRDGYAWYSRAAQPTAAEQQMWERGLANMSGVLAWGAAAGYFNPGDHADQARLLLAMQQTRFANWVMDGMRAAHTDVVVQIQADFVRLCCLPGVAAKLLAADGAGLNPKTLARIRTLAGQLAQTGLEHQEAPPT